MTPGEAVDDAATAVNRAGGALTTMVVKRRIVRGTLDTILSDLADAVEKLRKVLG